MNAKTAKILRKMAGYKPSEDNLLDREYINVGGKKRVLRIYPDNTKEVVEVDNSRFLCDGKRRIYRALKKYYKNGGDLKELYTTNKGEKDGE